MATQSGSDVAGTFGGGRIVCTSGGLQLIGTANGGTVTFNIDGSYWHHEGILAANSLSGTLQFAVSPPYVPATTDFFRGWSGAMH